MGRLIDADKAIFELGVSDRDIYCKYYIEEQPTAYDVEKVVEELEELKESIGFIRAIPEANAYIKAIRQAIDIVRNGGVK